MTNDERVKRAVENFLSGYNCAQSVVLAFADLYGIPERLAMQMSASFGAGIGRMRLTCGAACGMMQLAGFEQCAQSAADRAGKSANYRLVQQLAERFKAETGSLTCAELLGLAPMAGRSPEAEPRTTEYYRKRPCPRMVELGARIFADYLESKNAGQERAEAAIGQA